MFLEYKVPVIEMKFKIIKKMGIFPARRLLEIETI